MRTIALVGAVTAAGVVGGIAGALVVQDAGGPSRVPRAPAAPEGDSSASDASLAKEVAALRARVEELQAAATAANAESARLRTALEQQEKASAESRGRLERLEAAPNAAGLQSAMALTPENRDLLASRLRTVSLGALEAGGNVDRLRKSLELRLKPEEERWTATREALGLTAGQEEDLKTAIKDRSQAFQDAVKAATDTSSADGSVAIRVVTPDSEKMRDARKAYDDRVNQVLSADQAKKWRDEGYEDAFGGGGSRAIAIRSLRAGATDTTEPAK
jgi:hypothetical protein